MEERYPIPEGWVWTTLGEVCSFENGDRGKNYPSKGTLVDVGIPFVNAGSIDDFNRLDQGAISFISESHFNVLSQGKFNPGDILFCLRGSLGKHALVTNLSGAIASSLVIVRSDLIMSEYVLNYFSSSLCKDEITDREGGSAQPNLGLKDLRKFIFPLPPLTEQKRIVAKIEALEAKRKTAQEAIASLATLIDQFRQSVLAQAFCGQLTADWRQEYPATESGAELLQRIAKQRQADWEQEQLAKFAAKGKTPKNDKWKEKYKAPAGLSEEQQAKLRPLPEGWVWTTLGEVCEINMGQSPEGRYTNTSQEGFGLLGGASEFKESEVRVTRWTTKAKKKCCPGDIVICIRATLGLARIVDRTYCLGRGVAALTPWVESCSSYVCSFLVFSEQDFEEKGTGSTFKQIAKDVICELPIPLPPLAEQQAIVERVEALFTKADAVAEVVATTEKQLEQLGQSILAQAFRGELVEQDPNDEPASVLLEQIRAYKQQAKASKKKANKEKAKKS